MPFYTKKTCKRCGKEYEVSDEYLYYSDGYNYLEHYCSWNCYSEVRKDMVIKLISSLMDTLDEKQKENLVDLLEMGLEDVDLREIICEHFKGWEGLRSWGLW